MKILITGCNGLIGKILMNSLEEYELYGIDIKESNDKRCYKADISDFDELKEVIEKGSADQSQIKEKIGKLESEINDLVYQIYGVTREERKIVEGNL